MRRVSGDVKGAWQDHRERHIGGNFLLIYRIDCLGQDEMIIFVRCGTHADLYEE